MRLKRGKGFASYREELEVMNDLSKVFDDLKCRRDWYYWDRILVDGAKAWRDLLARLGFEGDLVSHLPEVKKNYGDDSLPAMLAEIVILIELIAVERTRLERAGGDVSVLIAATVECAHRRERIYWKHGISPDIGMTFEESALIVPYRGESSHHPQNGLLLRADLHSLFDLGLLAVDSATMNVLLAPRLRDSAYGELHGHRLRPAGDPAMGPSREALEQHRRWAGI
jgi:hypothetical protein